MAKRRLRVGLCTGGGDCPGLNSAIRSVVQVATRVHGFEVLGVRRGLSGLLEGDRELMALTLEAADSLQDFGGTILGTNNSGSPFRNREQAGQALAKVKAAWRRHKLDALIAIGGDGTQYMCKNLVTAGLPVVGIPKTIDNDLLGTERTIGFATALQVATEAAQRLRTSALSHDRLMLLEVMGRDAGHIALGTALAVGAEFALIPELPFSPPYLSRIFAERCQKGRSAALMIVAEGAAPVAGGQIFHVAGGKTKVLGGIASQLANSLHQATGIDARASVLGHVQRGGAPLAEDRILAAQFAHAAVGLVAGGDYGRIVAWKGGKITSFSYDKVVDRRRLVAKDSPELLTAIASGIDFAQALS